jgi:geranylgeranyl diphosphate synthase type II
VQKTEVGLFAPPEAVVAAVAAGREVCPAAKQVRERLRAMAADRAASWRSSGGIPSGMRSEAGLRTLAGELVRRAGGLSEHVGWAMVAILTEYWRPRLSSAAAGRRLLLLPDCPCAARRRPVGTSERPVACGPDCTISTIWSAAEDSGWVVQSAAQGSQAIGGLLTGQYAGILGVAPLDDLAKAFSMLPVASLPVAAVPFDQAAAAAAAADGGCGSVMEAARLDVDWVLGLLGVAGGQTSSVGDYLPLLGEAARLFTAEGMATLEEQLLVPAGELLSVASPQGETVPPLAAASRLSGDFLSRGGKFLRPFITLAAYEAVMVDRGTGSHLVADRSTGGSAAAGREAVRAAAVAIEVFHKASLVHDDIEDADMVRYGRPTLHREWGVPTAINTGDYLLGVGYRIVAGLPHLPPDMQRDLVAILADAHVRLARGQGAELWWRDAADKRLTPAASLEMYALKTSPAFEAALAMGIRMAGISPSAVGAIDRYARHVGTAFQILNDLKDWQGDVENDRRAAGDLLGGRPTLMWALALERLPLIDARRLEELAREGAKADDEAARAAAVDAVRVLYERAEVFSRARQIVAQERLTAGRLASGCPFPRCREVLEFLLDLAVPEQATHGAAV